MSYVLCIMIEQKREIRGGKFITGSNDILLSRLRHCSIVWVVDK